MIVTAIGIVFGLLAILGGSLSFDFIFLNIVLQFLKQVFFTGPTPKSTKNNLYLGRSTST